MASRLTEARLDRHLKQVELAKLANVQAHVITNIEAGHTVNPSAEAFIRLCRFLNLRPEWLLDGEGEKFVPGPVDVKAPEPVTIERVPLVLANTLLMVVEEMHYGQFFCPEGLDVGHVRRWLAAFLEVPELRAVGDHFKRATLESDPAQPGTRPTLVVNNTGLLPVRTLESGGALPKPEAQPVMGKTARLTTPAASRASAPIDDLPPIVVSYDPFKGTKLGRIKKGSYTDLQLRKRTPMRKDGKLRQFDVCALMGISPSSFYVMQQNDPDFPQPCEFQPNGKAAAYERKDFERFLALKIMQRHEHHEAQAS
jgi:DNA-binding XRE family transcriptional regulator/predicted DNA-binding transcriptional regulator AlpA